MKGWHLIAADLGPEEQETWIDEACALWPRWLEVWTTPADPPERVSDLPEGVAP